MPITSSRRSGRTVSRRLPVGAECLEDGVHFRVWAPNRKHVEVVLEGRDDAAFELELEEQGYFSGLVSEASPGTRYRFRLDGEDTLYPDPASRLQPDGPHGPSEVIDPRGFAWSDHAWQGVSLPGQVIYETHVGTLTPEGTWEAAARELPSLADLGVTLLELMPVADFPGRFGWGYDGVDLFAPTRLYGRPDDFRSFVNEAHRLGLGVILDVVYNHFGPDGCYLKSFSPYYFTDRYRNDWGAAINFDGPHSGPVREFVLANVRYWVKEFHLDGFRLDATQDIHDASSQHILREITQEARTAAGRKGTLIIAENEPQDTVLVRSPQEGGMGADALWNDDFHHSAMVVIAGHSDAYYTDYRGDPQEFISAAKYGYLYQGQWYAWQKKRRGTPTRGVPPAAFVNFIQNHDQIANSVHGRRCHQLCSPALYRTMTALLLLSPGTPMLFQGQEYASSQPFYYFADHREELARLVHQGRKEFMAQFPNAALAEVQSVLPDPADPQTFMRSKLDPAERDRNREARELHRDLLRLRREDPTFRKSSDGRLDGAVLGHEAFVLRYFGEIEQQDRLLLVNFGPDLHWKPAPEPLLAPPEGMEWGILWSSEDPRYGGVGAIPPEAEESWYMPGQAAMVVESRPRRTTDDPREVHAAAQAAEGPPEKESP